MPMHWYQTDRGFDELLSWMGRDRFVKVAAREMGYPSVEAWANGHAYEGAEVRGSMRRGKYHQPCNAVSGEIG